MEYYGFAVGHPAAGEGPNQTYRRLFDLVEIGDEPVWTDGFSPSTTRRSSLPRRTFCLQQ
jgi:hypothetical protein